MPKRDSMCYSGDFGLKFFSIVVTLKIKPETIFIEKT